MRTTLTIDDDVAVQLEQLRRGRGLSLKDAVNDALRRGLMELSARPAPRTAFRTAGFDMGRVKLPILDNVAEALAIAEGEDFR